MHLSRDIRRFANDPKPLRSNERPEGLEGLSQRDQERVGLANTLFAFSCRIFLLAASSGVLTTMECLFLDDQLGYKELLLKVTTFETNFQVCMFGGSRDKWTKVLASFKSIETMDARCNRQHKRAPWCCAFNDEGHQVWATSLESRYPCKMCVVLTQLVLQVAENQGLRLPAVDLARVGNNPLKTSLHSQGGAQRQPKRLQPLVPDFESVANFLLQTYLALCNLSCLNK